MKSKKQKNANKDMKDECITLGFTNDNFGSNAVQILNKICTAISIGFSVRYGEVVYKGVKINSMKKYSYDLQKKVLDKTLEGEEYIKRFKLKND